MDMEKCCCPVCRATFCMYNEKDTCMREVAGSCPGYNCPDFCCFGEDEEESSEVIDIDELIDLALSLHTAIEIWNSYVERGI